MAYLLCKAILISILLSRANGNSLDIHLPVVTTQAEVHNGNVS